MNKPSAATYEYKAMQADGKMRSGRIAAANEAEAYARLRADNVSPVALKPVRPRTKSGSASKGLFKSDKLGEQELEDLFQSLAVLLKAGADIRTALTVIGSEGPMKAVAQAILSGSSLDSALGSIIPPAYTHLRGLIAAGEVRGDLPSGLEAAATVLATRRKIRQQLIEAISYPAFVFVTALAALAVILLVVVPAIVPLLEDSGQDVPVYFKIIIFMSETLQQGWAYMLAGFAALGAGLIIAYRYGGLKAWMQRWWLDGPLGVIVRPMVYGGYAKTLGDSLKSGASLMEALRLCQKSVSNTEAIKRLDVIVTLIRQGRTLSEALRQVGGFPSSIVRLCEVGEASSALGDMLSRAGEREEQQALARIDRLSKLLGPLLIMVLGLMIGGLMAGVLSALTDIGSVSGV